MSINILSTKFCRIFQFFRILYELEVGRFLTDTEETLIPLGFGELALRAKNQEGNGKNFLREGDFCFHRKIQMLQKIQKDENAKTTVFKAYSSRLWMKQVHGPAFARTDSG